MLERRRTADGPDARSGPLQDSGPNRAHRSPTRVSSLAHTHTHITHMDTAPGRTCGSVGAARRSHRPPCRLPLWQREASRRLHAASSWGGGRRPGATVAPSPRAERGVPAGRLPTEAASESAATGFASPPTLLPTADETGITADSSSSPCRATGCPSMPSLLPAADDTGTMADTFALPCRSIRSAWLDRVSANGFTISMYRRTISSLDHSPISLISLSGTPLRLSSVAMERRQDLLLTLDTSIVVPLRAAPRWS